LCVLLASFSPVHNSLDISHLKKTAILVEDVKVKAFAVCVPTCANDVTREANNIDVNTHSA
jgi:hypothetical protein